MDAERDGPLRVPMSYRKEAWPFLDPQLSSPFYNGRIPAELRSLIFEFALSETIINPVNHDFFVRHDHVPAGDVPFVDPIVECGGGTADARALDSEDDPRSPEALDGGGIPEVPHTSSQHPGETLIQPQAGILKKDPSLGFDWLRPGHTGKPRLYTALLRTCRRVYLETHDLPPKMLELVFYNDRAPPWSVDIQHYFQQINPDAARQVRSVHVYAQMYWLENSFTEICSGRFRQSLPRMLMRRGGPHLVRPVLRPAPWRVSEHLASLRITLRRSDWWDWEINRPLVITPFKYGRPSLQDMQKQMRLAPDVVLSGQIRGISGWGDLVFRMLNLKRFVIDFETSKDKEDEMADIVAWAETWQFIKLDELPSNGSGLGLYHPYHLEGVKHSILTTEGNETQKNSWRGLSYHFSDTCPGCDVRGETVTPDCFWCCKKQQLVSLGKGPRLLVWTVTWTPKPGSIASSSDSPQRNSQTKAEEVASEDKNFSVVYRMSRDATVDARLRDFKTLYKRPVRF